MNPVGKVAGVIKRFRTQAEFTPNNVQIVEGKNPSCKDYWKTKNRNAGRREF